METMTPVMRIETERLILRRMVFDDMAHLTEMLSDAEVMKYYSPPARAHTAQSWFQRVDEVYRTKGSSFLAVELKGTGAILGQAGILFQDVEGVEEQEVGYMFKRRYWGNGYATEAALGCMRYAAAHFSPRRIISLINPANDPSIRVARRNGLVLDRLVTKWESQLAMYAIGMERFHELHG